MPKILSINASYYVKGGADRFFVDLNTLLLKNGYQVISFTTVPALPNTLQSNPNAYFTKKYDEKGGISNKLSNLIRIFRSLKIENDLKKVLCKEKPDIAIVHNIYHRMPYGIVKILKKHNVKILWWLHDYKWICPNHQLFTHGSVCRKCLKSSYLNAVRYRCQKGSLIESIIVTLFSYYISLNRYQKFIDYFIAPSRFCAKMHSNLNNVVCIEHFNQIKHPQPESLSAKDPNPHALYVGRIEQNKGIKMLVDCFMETKFKLKIVGEGSILQELQQYCGTKGFGNIEFEGFQPPEKLSTYYLNALFTVVPSQWYEVFGLTILESFSYGKPVVASKSGAISEIIEHGKSGLLFDTYNPEDLKNNVVYMFNHREEVIEMGKYAHSRIAERYSPEIFMKNLRNVLNSLY